MIDNKFAQNLENLINESVRDAVIPSYRENTVKIKNYLIRKTRQGYVVFDIVSNTQVAYTNFKTSAVALAKSLTEGKDSKRKVLYLDNVLLKNYNDAVFYKNIIQKTKDQQIKESRRICLDIALDRTNFAKKQLEDFIFQKINN